MVMLKKITPSEYTGICRKFEGSGAWRVERNLHKREDGRIRRTFCSGQGDFALLVAFLKDSIAERGQSEPPKSFETGTWDMLMLLRRKPDPNLRILLDAFPRKDQKIGAEYSHDMDPSYYAVLNPESETAETMIERVSMEIHLLNAAIVRVINNPEVKIACGKIQAKDALVSAVASLTDDNIEKIGLLRDVMSMTRPYQTAYDSTLGMVRNNGRLQEAMQAVADKD